MGWPRAAIQKLMTESHMKATELLLGAISCAIGLALTMVLALTTVLALTIVVALTIVLALAVVLALMVVWSGPKTTSSPFSAILGCRSELNQLVRRPPPSTGIETPVTLTQDNDKDTGKSQTHQRDPSVIPR